MGKLVFQATLGGQVNLVGPNTASTYDINVPAVAGNMVTTGDTGTVTNTMLAGSIANVKLTNSSVTIGSTSVALGATSTTLDGVTTLNGLTVGKGAGSVATNTAVGASALAANTTGQANTAVGANALLSNTTGDDNVAVGATHVGVVAGPLQKNTTGSRQTAVGVGALSENTTGTQNTGFGFGSLANNTTGSYNVSLGTQSLASNTTASYNTAVGYQAGYSNTTGRNSTIGAFAGYSITTGTFNTLVGDSAGYNISTGSKNTVLGTYNGNQGGLDIRTANNYIVLSDGDGNPRQVIDGVGQPIWGPGVGNGVSGINTASFAYDGSLSPILTFNTNYGGGTKSSVQFKRNSTVVGSITENGTSTAYNTSSDYRLKENIVPMTGALAKVSALKPVTYTWKVDGSEGEGFIAHELAEVCPHAVTGEKDAIDADGNPQYQGIDVSFLVGTLTAAIQELNAKVDAQAAEIAALKGQA